MREGMVLAATLAAFITVPPVLARSLGGWASPRALVALYATTLAGLAALPVLIGACVFDLGAIPSTLDASSGACGGAVPGRWQLLGAALVSVWVGWLGRCLVQAARCAHRVELGAAVRRAAGRAAAPGGDPVWVLPVSDPIAYTGGLVHVRSVVSSGLLATLDQAQAGAVLAHEAAHRRFGHVRLLLWGTAVAEAYRWLPPVRWAWQRLRREIEVCADEAAVAAVGADALISALGRVVLARRPAAAFVEADTLRYRLTRLRQGPPRPRTRVGAVVVGVVVAAVVGGLSTALALASCVSLTPQPSWVALAGCALSVAILVVPQAAVRAPIGR